MPVRPSGDPVPHVARRLTGWTDWAARAGLLAHAGQAELAIQTYDRAIGLEVDPAVRRSLQTRRGELLS